VVTFISAMDALAFMKKTGGKFLSPTTPNCSFQQSAQTEWSQGRDSPIVKHYS
jgi:hypothetical protein